MEQNHQITLSEWAEMKEAIRRELSNVKHAFVRVGYYLRRAEDDKLYLTDGYQTLSEFAEKEYGLGASTVSRLISINRKFSLDGYSPQLLPEYDGYRQSVLTEMLALPQEDMQMVTPDTPREAVRELVRFNRQDTGEEGELSSFLHDFLRSDPEVVKALADTGGDSTEKEIREIMNPAGNRVYRKGAFFMSMSETDIKLKKIGGKPQAFSYKDFLEMARPIAEELWEEAQKREENARSAIENARNTEENAQTAEVNAQGTTEEERDEQEENGEAAEKEENRQGDAETAEGNGEDDQRAEEDVDGGDGEDGGAEVLQEPDHEGTGSDNREFGHDRGTPDQTGEGSESQEGEEEEKGEVLGSNEEPEASEGIRDRGAENGNKKLGAEAPDVQIEDDGEDGDHGEPCGTIIAKRTIRLQKTIYDAVDQGLTDSILTADAGVRIGDTVELMSFEDSRYTGYQTKRKVKYLLSGVEGLEKGYCLMTFC